MEQSERFEKLSHVGRGGWTRVHTRWVDSEQGWVTNVHQFLGCEYQPWEWHLSKTEKQARSTHHRAVRRYPKTGTPDSRPPREVRDGRCTRCGAREGEEHARRCAS